MHREYGFADYAEQMGVPTITWIETLTNERIPIDGWLEDRYHLILFPAHAKENNARGNLLTDYPDNYEHITLAELTSAIANGD